jgi:hypothetical protein
MKFKINSKIQLKYKFCVMHGCMPYHPPMSTPCLCAFGKGIGVGHFTMDSPIDSTFIYWNFDKICAYKVLGMK